jgi:NADPH-dependent curcumin reductase CurA
MAPPTQTVITLRQRPVKDVIPAFNSQDSTFNLLKDQPVPTQAELKDGEVVVRIEWCGIEPSMRAWLSDARGYLPPVKIDEVMRSILLGTVVATKSTKFKVGDMCKGTGGWAEYMVLPAKELSQVR